MPKWLKIVLALLVFFVLLCGGLSAVGFYWFDANKERLKGVGDRAHAEAAEYAMTHNANDCVTAALGRLTQRNSIVDEAEHKIFLKACIEKAEKPAGFCTGVPVRSEIFASAEWAVEKCKTLGYAGSQPCGRLVQAIQEACHPRK
ncbi:MAG: hypothetical protein ACO1OB_10575 [Archangium sp.]